MKHLYWVFIIFLGCGQDDTKDQIDATKEATKETEQVEVEPEPTVEPETAKPVDPKPIVMSAYSFDSLIAQACDEGYVNAWDIDLIEEQAYKDQIDSVLVDLKRGDQVFYMREILFYLPEQNGLVTKEYVDMTYSYDHVIAGNSINICVDS
jgi:hypothetical protein